MAERPFPDLISWQNLDICLRWGPDVKCMLMVVKAMNISALSWETIEGDEITRQVLN
jgi:hypothetical protein